jgi:hypothetical protein
MALINALDQQNETPFQKGENGITEYGWSNNIREKMAQFYFQLVRTKNTSTLEKELNYILTSLKKQYESGQTVQAVDYLTFMYKLIGHTRDIVAGKGEYALTYMQILGWYAHFPNLAEYAFDKLVQHSDANPSEVKYANEQHAYGSWKDMKFFCQYVYEATKDKKHPLIMHAIHHTIETLRHDYDIFHKKQPISLAAKWCPREKGKYSWIYKELVYHSYKHYFDTARDSNTRYKAYKKASRDFRFSLSTLNKYLDTVQIKMCGQEWSSINFNHVTSVTMRKNKLAFTNKTKQGNLRSSTQDRIDCAVNLTRHVEEAIENSKKSNDDPTKTDAKVHGKRAGVYELVQDALKVHPTNDKDKDEYKIVNLQWQDNSTQNHLLGNMIPMADTSGSMSCDKCIPLFNSIGLSIRLSEIVAPEFRNRIMTFSNNPTWVNLSDCDNFVSKVHKTRDADWGMNTNFHAAMKLILDVIVQNNMKPENVEDLVLAVFSDMQFDDSTTTNQETMYQQIEKMYHDAGMKTIYATPYKPPHILFWNLRNTSGFPTLSTQKNVTMLSGYSPVLLNAFYNKGMDAIRDYDPYKMIQDVLSSDRYDVMGNKIGEALPLM